VESFWSKCANCSCWLEPGLCLGILRVGGGITLYTCNVSNSLNMVEYAAVGNALERADRGKKKFVRNARGGVFIYLREDCSRDSSLKVNSVLAVV
jgi:hypothetical protein